MLGTLHTLHKEGSLPNPMNGVALFQCFFFFSPPGWLLNLWIHGDGPSISILYFIIHFSLNLIENYYWLLCTN